MQKIFTYSFAIKNDKIKVTVSTLILSSLEYLGVLFYLNNDIQKYKNYKIL